MKRTSHHHLHHDRHKKSGSFSAFKAGLVCALLLAAGSLFTPYPAQLVRALNGTPDKAPDEPAPGPVQPVVAPEPQPTPAPAPEPAKPNFVPPTAWTPEGKFAMPDIQLPPFPPALPERVTDGTFEHVNALTDGRNMLSRVQFTPGTTAFTDRQANDAYLVNLTINLRLPQAATGVDMLQANPQLPTVLNNYSELMAGAEVSPWFHSLYLHKQNRIRKNAATLDRLLDRHNFYDTNTILQIKAPGNGRKILWMQSDMDVVSDGSDGDRLPHMPKEICESDYYQYGTSYRWRKVGKTPNPLLPHWEERLKKLRKDKKASKADIEHAKVVVADLKLFSFLLSEYDPFIVIPLTFKEGKDDTFRPEPGDYAAVIVEDRVYPAIVGDFGPNFKTGEASLRLAKTVNPKASPYSRAVTMPNVSYLVFPGTKPEKSGPPDYDRLHNRVRELLDDIGGLGPNAKFQQIPDLLKK